MNAAFDTIWMSRRHSDETRNAMVALPLEARQSPAYSCRGSNALVNYLAADVMSEPLSRRKGPKKVLWSLGHGSPSKIMRKPPLPIVGKRPSRVEFDSSPPRVKEFRQESWTVVLGFKTGRRNEEDHSRVAPFCSMFYVRIDDGMPMVARQLRPESEKDA
ncbi:hypothetical protein PM082_000513 [Marasmius tenuissimus]|nr:hypothetical protein PM082_000513 [Marasmius tenuissimus]